MGYLDPSGYILHYIILMYILSWLVYFFIIPLLLTESAFCSGNFDCLYQKKVSAFAVTPVFIIILKKFILWRRGIHLISTTVCKILYLRIFKSVYNLWFTIPRYSQREVISLVVHLIKMAASFTSFAVVACWKRLNTFFFFFFQPSN